jgi:uncharacterized protein involved in outer membrane biogenesis
MKLKHVLLGLIGLAVVLAIGLFFWARSVLTGDAVRSAVATQLSAALGQPVHIDGLGVSVLPRVSMNLHGVRIGSPARLTAARLRVGTALGALLSRRIEHADIHLDGARIELPLPRLRFGSGGGSSGATPAAPPISLVSVDEIRLNDIEVSSGGRLLRGDAHFAWHAGGLTVHRVGLAAGDTRISLKGEITDPAGPVGDLQLTASGLSVLELAAFFSDFSTGIGGRSVAGGTDSADQGASGTAAPPGGRMNLTISLDANRAAFGALSIDALSGQARVTPEHVAIEPIRFGVFGGTYDGALTITLGDVPQIHMKAAVAGIDTAAAMAFAERPGAMTGRASGTIDLTGRGTTGDRILDTAQGTVRLEVADGTVKGLSLVRAVVLATSMRQDSKAQLGSTLRDETFSRMGLSAQITSGTAATRDLRFESSDVLFSAAGLVRLDGTSVDLAGDVQLSEALSKQAGRDLYRYTRKDGRVTLPATITGPVDKLQVRLNVGDAAKRAIANKAAEELKKRLRRIIR